MKNGIASIIFLIVKDNGNNSTYLGKHVFKAYNIKNYVTL